MKPPCVPSDPESHNGKGWLRSLEQKKAVNRQKSPHAVVPKLNLVEFGSITTMRSNATKMRASVVNIGATPLARTREL